MVRSSVDSRFTASEHPVALITGGASRIGRAIAQEFARAGMDIAITFTNNAQRASEVVVAVQDVGRRGVALQTDFSDLGAVAQLHSEFQQHFSHLDVLVNNASVFSASPVPDLTLSRCEYFMRINALAPLLLTQAFSPMLRANFKIHDPTRCGRVINFVDIHVLGEPLPGFVAYNASKAALLEITRTLALDLAPAVTVNAIAPGVVGWADFHSEAYKADYLRRVPLAREGKPEEVAKAALFLARDATYCSGQVIRLDGGRLLS